MKKILPVVLLTTATLCWGANFHFAKVALQELPPYTVAAFRFGTGFLVLLPVLLLFEKVNWTLLKRKLPVLLLLGFVGIFCFNFFFFIGMKYTSAANGSLIMALNPLLTVLLSSLFLGLSMTRLQFTGLFVSLIGVIVIISQGKLDVLLGLNFALGDILMLGASLSFAIFNLLSRRYAADVSPMLTSAVTMLTTAVLFTIISGWQGNLLPEVFLSLSWQTWVALLFMGIFAAALGYICWIKGVALIGVNKASAYMNLVPFFAMLISATLGIALTGAQLIGGAVIIFGLLIASGNLVGADVVLPFLKRLSTSK